MTHRAAWLLPCALALAGCGSAPEAAPWTELFDGRSLTGWVSSDFGGDGPIAVRDGGIELGMGGPLTGITWTREFPTSDYELEVTAARRQGNDFFCALTFPVGDSHLSVVLGGWGGTVCGFSNLDGLDAAHNGSRRVHGFALDRAYRLRVRVAAEAITAWLDDALLCRCDPRRQSVSLRPEVLPSRPLGIASFATRSSVLAVRWRRT